MAEVGYEPFGEVDPYTSPYFIALEDSPGLVEEQGEERLYNLGVRVCRDLDDGGTVDEALVSMQDDAGIGAPGAKTWWRQLS